MFSRRFKNLLLILALTSFNLAGAKKVICPVKVANDCASFLRNYPLFDTDYKVAANYVPMLPLRALANGEIYKKKKSFHIERFFYVKNLKGDLGKAYQSIILDGEVTGFGIFSRKIVAEGKLNEFDLYYENNMSFALPRKANMKVKAKLDDIEFLKLKIHSDGVAMTNDVEGVFFGREVDYHTDWRTTNGNLAGITYNIFAAGEIRENDGFDVTMEGSIGSYSMKGFGKKVSDKQYQSSEDYGPIIVKSFITIK